MKSSWRNGPSDTMAIVMGLILAFLVLFIIKLGGWWTVHRSIYLGHGPMSGSPTKEPHTIYFPSECGGLEKVQAYHRFDGTVELTWVPWNVPLEREPTAWAHVRFEEPATLLEYDVDWNLD